MSLVLRRHPTYGRLCLHDCEERRCAERGLCFLFFFVCFLSAASPHGSHCLSRIRTGIPREHLSPDKPSVGTNCLSCFALSDDHLNIYPCSRNPLSNAFMLANSRFCSRFSAIFSFRFESANGEQVTYSSRSIRSFVPHVPREGNVRVRKSASLSRDVERARARKRHLSCDPFERKIKKRKRKWPSPYRNTLCPFIISNVCEMYVFLCFHLANFM